ncbi:tetraacyldisaccharide 4'-kinase [Spirosoma spitsbergense]|uniref:tetraacyldisaccharide 4'-kinase n=1 Tax=Spirosoma spitsbergense TaxID=431554 RepID=UPI0003633D08
MAQAGNNTKIIMKRSVGEWLLSPLSGVYGLLTDVRNWLYDNDLLATQQPNVQSVSVGNLTVGGTGKTPMVEFLIKRSLTAGEFRAGALATLSRGYGRKTTGFRVATASDTADTIGDEPLQLYRKFTSSVRVCVGERRVEAVKSLLERHPETKRVLLDDAFQHRPLAPHVSILLMDYNRPFYEDLPFPGGRLRERRKGARRADVLVVTKCPLTLSLTEQTQIANRIRPYTRPETPLFFAGLAYDAPVSFATGQSVTNLRAVVLVSGLANATPLEQYVRQHYHLVRHDRFADHHPYTRPTLEKLVNDLPADTALLTTEKDWVKLDALLMPAERATWPLYYLPVAMQFLAGQEQAFLAVMDGEWLKNR